jgi:capsular exopolysaccharide synthesis family protein
MAKKQHPTIPSRQDQNGTANGHAAPQVPNGTYAAPPDASHPLPANGAVPPSELGERGREEGVYRRSFDRMALPTEARFISNNDDDQNGNDFRQILAVVFRRWKVALLAFLMVVACGVAYTWSARPIYQAKSVIQVTSGPTNRPSSGMPALEEMLSGLESDSVGTQVEVIKNSSVQWEAQKRLQPPLRDAIRSYSTVDVAPVSETDLINISVRSHNPAAASNLANAICDEFIAQSKEKNQGQLRGATNYVYQQLQDVRDRLNRARTSLMRYKQNTGSFDLGEESKGIIGQLAGIQSQLRDGESERAANVAQVARLRQLANNTPRTEVAPNTIVRRPAIENIKAQLTKLELERLALLEEYTDNSPEVRTVEGQIANIRARLSREAQTEVGTWTRNVNPLRQQLDQDIARLQGQVWAQEARQSALRTAASRVQSELQNLPSREYKLGQLTTEMAGLQQIYQMLNERYQTLRIQQEASVANAIVVARAVTPSIPISPRKLQNVLASIILGLLVAMGLASLVDRLDDRVHSDDDVRRATHLPVLAHLPFIRNDDEKVLLHHREDASPLLENFRMLRTNIRFSAVDRPIDSIVVTSSLPGEGKSSTSTNLAVAAALSGERVILVDCDLRRPMQHKLSRLPNRVGLSNLIAGTATLEEALQDTSVPGLQIITSGPTPPDPFKMLNSDAGMVCFEHITQAADFVIFDAPPSLMLADAHIMATVADGVLLVVSSRDARRQAVIRTREFLSRTGAEIVGVVLNKVDMGIAAAYGHSYYHKAYRNYFEEEGEDAQEHDAQAADVQKTVSR